MKSKNSKTNNDVLLQKMFDRITEHLIANFLEPILDRLESLEKALIPSSNGQIQEIKSKPMTVAVLCEYLDCKAPSVYAKVSRSEIPHYKEPRGRRLYFIKEEIDSWLIGKK